MPWPSRQEPVSVVTCSGAHRLRIKLGESGLCIKLREPDGVTRMQLECRLNHNCAVDLDLLVANHGLDRTARLIGNTICKIRVKPASGRFDHEISFHLWLYCSQLSCGVFDAARGLRLCLFTTFSSQLG